MASAATTPYASASLYIGDLATDVTEALLFEIFNAVGPVASVRVCRDAATRRSLGYAYVNFHRVDDAERALDTMNFKSIRGRPCRIMWSHRDPSLRKSGVGNIFVKNLAKTIDNKSLYDTFSMFGNILSCKVSTNAKGESLGYGFVHYESEEAAMNAISRVDGKLITGEKVEVSAFKSRKERGGNKFRFTNVYVKNLPTEWNREQLEGEFKKYGEVTSLMLAVDEEGKSKGFGFVNFKNPEDASSAVEALNGLELGEKKLYVVRAQKKEEREKELRERFEQLKIERQKKYAGVNLYVKNLGDDVDDERLHAEFAKFGTITSAHVMRDSNNKSKGFGFVCFSTPEEATKCATEMNGRMLNMKPLYVALAQRKEVRRAQLEAQYAQRAKVGMPMPQPHVFPGGMPGQVPGGPTGGPMFYQGVPQRNFVTYPQQMMARQWNLTSQPGGQQGSQQGGAMQMRPPHPSVGYQLMAMNQQQRPGRGRAGQNRPASRPQQPKGGPQQAQAAPVQPAGAQGPLTAKALAEANDEQKKQMIGERLFPLIKANLVQQPSLAGKITGMLLEMDNTELLHLLESPQALGEKIQEALEVLNEHGAETSEQ
jgi:polyadenylate-binding protein